MVDVFISYSRTNKDKVARIARGVEEAGYDVWWDAELPPHQSYGDVITAKIQGAKAAIVVWSAEAAASEWVRAEADVARNQKKLVQTALGDITPPLPFNQIQYANLGDWNGEKDHPEWRKVKASLADLCGPPRAKEAPAEPIHAFPATPPPAAEEPVTEDATRKPAAGKPAPAKPILPTSTAKPAAAAAAKPAPAAAGTPSAQPATKPAPLLGGGGSDPGDGAVRSGGVPVPVVIGGGVALLGLAGAAFLYLGSNSAAGESDKPGEETEEVAEAQALLDSQPAAPEEEDKPADAAPVPAAPASAAPQAAPAQRQEYNRDVRLINQTGDTIMYLYWSDTSQQNWGADRLGSDVFPAGNAWDVTIDDGNGACEYDIMAVTSANRQIVHNAVNVCSVYEIYFN